MARKEFAKVADLKASSARSAGRSAPRRMSPCASVYPARLDPEKDVKFVQMGRPDWPNVIVQLEKGDVQFSVLPPPFDRIAEARGIHKLYALPDLGIQWQQNGEWVLKSYLASNRDDVVRVERALADAMKFYFNNKEKTIAYLVDFSALAASIPNTPTMPTPNGPTKIPGQNWRP